MKLLTTLFILYGSIVYGQVSDFTKFKALSGPEKCWVFSHLFVAKKALLITEMVREEAHAILKENALAGSGNGGQIDAFRHVFWMANLTHSIGWRRARRLGIAHERGNYLDFKKGREEEGVVPDKISSEMDLFNNKVGIELGKISLLENIKLAVVESILSGKCKILRMDENGNYLDSKGKVLSEESFKGKWENDKCLVWSNE